MVDATSTFVTATSTTTLTNKTLTAPKFADGGFIADANGAEALVFGAASTAVNELKITNAATGCWSDSSFNFHQFEPIQI